MDGPRFGISQKGHSGVAVGSPGNEGLFGCLLPSVWEMVLVAGPFATPPSHPTQGPSSGTELVTNYKASITGPQTVAKAIISHVTSFWSKPSLYMCC